jgi:peptide deformylase
MTSILLYPNPILDEVMPEFNFEEPIVDPKELESKLLASMFANNGIGLAAPQIGIRTRVFSIGHALMPENSFAAFNPEILECSDTLREAEEGCLSFPMVWAKVKRPTWITVKYFTSDNEEKTNRLEGYDAICFLHELDHLNGVVFKDRLSTLKWAMAVKKSKKVRNYVRT